MLPEYLKYWGLSKPPFSLTPDPDMLYLSKQHQEGLIRLKYAVVSNKGGALLVSEHAGDGKTSLLARLRRELDHQYQGNCHIVFIDHPTLTANQMVGEIARQLGVHTNTTDKLTLLNDLRSYLLECHGRNEKCVVMLDEGQMLCHRPDLLQELRILLNFCVSDAFLLTFIFSGQKPLDEAIRAMPEFYQRLPVRFFLRNLNPEDTRELIRYRLNMAGNSPDREIFSEDGYTGIFNFSKGCPRVICSVADLALVIAHSRFSSQVDFVSVSQACSDMNRTDGAYHYFHFLKSFTTDQQPALAQASSQETAVNCPSCGGGVLAEAKFCQHCGVNLVDSKAATAEQAPQIGESAQIETALQEEDRGEPEQLEETSQEEAEQPTALQQTLEDAAAPVPLSQTSEPVQIETALQEGDRGEPGQLEETSQEEAEQPAALQQIPEDAAAPVPPSQPGEPAPEEADQAVELEGEDELVESIEQTSQAVFQAKERVKICPDCGGGISVDARFCQHCGTDLVTPDSASFEVVVMQGQDDEEQAERASVAEEIHRGAEPAESVTGPGEKSVPPEEKAAPGQASPDNGSLRFVLESAEMPQDAEKALPEDQEEELEPAGEESPTEEPAQLREMEPGENQEITATREESAVEETGEAQAIEEPGLEKEEESGEGPEDQPEIIKCPFCGLDLSAEILECPNCGEKLLESEDEEPGEAEEIISLAEKPETGEDQGAAAAESPEDNGSEKDGEIEEASLVRNLLREVEELDLRKFILSESFIKDRRTPDLPDEELLVFPLRRFCGRCPVVRFTNGDQEESFTTRCGLVFTGSSIRFIFSDGLREISYRLLEKIDVEEFAKNDTALLCQLNLKTSTGGNYHIMLPFQASVARKLGETLRRYLVGKAHALADAAEEVRLNGKKEEREEDAS